MRDDRTFNGGMRDDNISAGTDLFILTDKIWDSYKIDGGIRKGSRKPHIIDVTRRTIAIETNILN